MFVFFQLEIRSRILRNAMCDCDVQMLKIILASAGSHNIAPWMHIVNEAKRCYIHKRSALEIIIKNRNKIEH